MGQRDRLNRLEDEHDGESKEDAEMRLREVRRCAEHAIRTRDPDKEPLLVVLSGGEVYARDGKLITTPLQVAAETFYAKELELGSPGLVHDEENQRLYTLGGELALSRDYVNLEHLWGDARMQAWKAEDEDV